MRDGITYDEVYEIAAEVCEEMFTKFLRNLVKLVPASEEIVDDIQEQQYEELKALRQEKLKESVNKEFTKPARPKPAPIPNDDFGLLGGNDFAAIAHPENEVKPGEDSSWAEKNDMDSALANMDLPPMGNIDD